MGWGAITFHDNLLDGEHNELFGDCIGMIHECKPIARLLLNKQRLQKAGM